MNPFNPRGLMEQVLVVCVGFMTCVIAINFGLYLLARVWYWVLLPVAAVGGG